MGSSDRNSGRRRDHPWTGSRHASGTHPVLGRYWLPGTIEGRPPRSGGLDRDLPERREVAGLVSLSVSRLLSLLSLSGEGSFRRPGTLGREGCRPPSASASEVSPASEPEPVAELTD